MRTRIVQGFGHRVHGYGIFGIKKAEKAPELARLERTGCSITVSWPTQLTTTKPKKKNELTKGVGHKTVRLHKYAEAA